MMSCRTRCASLAMVDQWKSSRVASCRAVVSLSGGVTSWAMACCLIVGVGWVVIAADHVDGLDQVGQAARLLGDHVAIELDDRRHLGRGGIARLAGADLADVRDCLRGALMATAATSPSLTSYTRGSRSTLSDDREQHRGHDANGDPSAIARARTGPRVAAGEAVLCTRRIRVVGG